MTLLDADLMERRNVVGEDTWELFATIEDSFGVSFPNYEPLLGKTVQELADCIAKESSYPKADRCLSSVAFYRLRRAFQNQVGNRRLIFIWTRGNVWVVATEHGGRGYNDPILAYQLDSNGLHATLIAERLAVPKTVCSTSEELLNQQPTGTHAP